jgi:hypothetical protein
MAQVWFTSQSLSVFVILVIVHSIVFVAVGGRWHHRRSFHCPCLVSCSQRPTSNERDDVTFNFWELLTSSSTGIRVLHGLVPGVCDGARRPPVADGACRSAIAHLLRHFPRILNVEHATDGTASSHRIYVSDHILLSPSCLSRPLSSQERGFTSFVSKILLLSSLSVGLAERSCYYHR